MNKPKHTGKKAKPESTWVEGSVQDLLQLSDADMEYNEMRLAARAFSDEVPLAARQVDPIFQIALVNHHFSTGNHETMKKGR